MVLTEYLKAVIMTPIIVCLQHENKTNPHALTLNKVALINSNNIGGKKPQKKAELSSLVLVNIVLLLHATLRVRKCIKNMQGSLRGHGIASQCRSNWLAASS